MRVLDNPENLAATADKRVTAVNNLKEVEMSLFMLKRNYRLGHMKWKY